MSITINKSKLSNDQWYLRIIRISKIVWRHAWAPKLENRHTVDTVICLHLKVQFTQNITWGVLPFTSYYITCELTKSWKISCSLSLLISLPHFFLAKSIPIHWESLNTRNHKMTSGEIMQSSLGVRRWPPLFFVRISFCVSQVYSVVFGLPKKHLCTSIIRWLHYTVDL